MLERNQVRQDLRVLVRVNTSPIKGNVANHQNHREISRDRSDTRRLGDHERPEIQSGNPWFVVTLIAVSVKDYRKQVQLPSITDADLIRIREELYKDPFCHREEKNKDPFDRITEKVERESRDLETFGMHDGDYGRASAAATSGEAGETLMMPRRRKSSGDIGDAWGGGASNDDGGSEAKRPKSTKSPSVHAAGSMTPETARSETSDPAIGTPMRQRQGEYVSKTQEFVMSTPPRDKHAGSSLRARVHQRGE